MYSYLIDRVGKSWANVLMVCWYVFLMLLVYYFSPADSGRFKYLEL